jgi:propionyl-CoA carboxylase beta chain
VTDAVIDVREDRLARVRAFVDPDSFGEFGSGARHRVHAFDMQRKRPAGDGVVTGVARVHGRPIGLFAQDPTSLGGSLGEVHAATIARILDHAGRARCPVVGRLDTGGARIQEGVAALDGYGEIFRRNVALSGRVPQVSVVLGPCAGGAVYSPALTDVVIMQRDRAHMFVTGPRVVKAVTFEDVSHADRGGSAVHPSASARSAVGRDPALRYSETGRRLLALLNRQPADEEEWRSYAEAVPAYRRTEMAHLARTCVAQWARFVELLEAAEKT